MTVTLKRTRAALVSAVLKEYAEEYGPENAQIMLRDAAATIDNALTGV